MNTQIEKLNDTIDLWNKVSSIADFNSKTNPYDEALLDEIKKELGFDAGCNISDELAVRKTSPEQLLAVLLKVMKPFSIMLKDLYEMFKEAGAQYSEKNIQIKFDFEDAKENFGLDLENFRQYIEKVEKVVNYKLQLESCSPFKDFVDPIKEILENKNFEFDQRNCPSVFTEINEWLKEYINKDLNWPDHFPVPPKSGIEKIDYLIDEIWQIPKVSNELYNKCYQSDLGRWLSLCKKERPTNFGFYKSESDFWIGSFVKLLCWLIYDIRKSENLELNIDEICNELETFNDGLPIVRIESERLVKSLLDILNLPVWKKRYALYSAWVATQIVSASNEWKPVYNVNKGVLSFSFGGSVITHLKYHIFDIELHAELNTWYDPKEMVGERIDHIQPDYSLCINGKSDPKNNTILVVECKQYKAPNKKNFQDAVIDYAGGRPNAQVILVNYTKINDTFKSGLKLIDKGKKVYDRIPYFNILSPGDYESCDSFKEVVRNSILNECSITLAWDESPKDLDLILEIIDSEGNIKRVDFQDRGNVYQYPFVYLNRDDQKGNGHETIMALILPSQKYNVLVHNYSGEATNGKISVSIKLGENEMMSKIYTNLNINEEWHVFTIENCSIQKIDVMIPKNF